MREDKRRYFIELQMGDYDGPRNRAIELRREQAAAFIGQIKEWMEKEELKDKVSSVVLTALGQVLITCEQEFIARLRDDDNLQIAAIRSSLPLSESVQRLGGDLGR